MTVVQRWLEARGAGCMVRRTGGTQILPLEAGAHPATTGEFTILAFPDLVAPDVVYLENMTSDLYVEQKPRCTATAWPLTGSAPWPGPPGNLLRS